MKTCLHLFIALVLAAPAYGQVTQRFQKVVITSNALDALVVLSTSISIGGHRVTVTGDVTLPEGGGSVALTAGSVVFVGTTGTTLAQDNANLFWNDSLNRLGILTASPVSALHLGAGSYVGAGADQLVTLSRAVTAALANGSLDASTITLGNGLFQGYISAHVSTKVDGTGLNPTAFFSGFESRPDFSGSITHGTYAGFVSIPHVNDTAALTNAYHVDIYDPIGTGTIGANYGLHVRALAKGVSNYAVYTEGTTNSHFGGTVDAAAFLGSNGAGLLATGDVRAGASNYFYWNARSGVRSPADGIILIDNNAGNNFTRLQLGGQTTSFPALGRTATNLTVLLADGSFGANLGIGTATFPGTGTSTLIFGDGTAPASMGLNTAGVYANDVSGTVEIFAINEAGAATQLTGGANCTLTTVAHLTVVNGTVKLCD